jgi:signal transduction histidine kinase
LPRETNFRKFLFRYAYLLLIAAWLITFSFIVDNYWSANASVKTVQNKLSAYVHKAEEDFQKTATDSSIISKMLNRNYDEQFLKKYIDKKYFLFVYTKDSSGNEDLIFWNTQQVQPYASLLYDSRDVGFMQMDNGYYVWKKLSESGYTAIALIPVKWNYIVSTDYLKNVIVVDPTLSLNYDISAKEDGGSSIRSVTGVPLFYLFEVAGETSYHNNAISVWLRILATLLVVFYLHFVANFISNRNIWLGIIFFIVVVGGIRLLSYYFPVPMNFRQFELFDPAVYGSNLILRSLGDLLINAALFVWFVLFLRYHIQDKRLQIKLKRPGSRWVLLFFVSSLLLIITYVGSHIVRSLVADSQISFDVVNFFSLNIYSAVGFLVLCCLAIAYYFLSQILLSFLRPYFPGFVPLFLFVAVEGLTGMSFMVSRFSSEFEFYVLIWLLIFLLLMSSRVFNMLASRLVSSKLVFWLFFFSVSISSLIIVENTEKELRNRKHYAEILSTKADPSNETLLNSMLTDFRTDFLLHNFPRLLDKASNLAFKDSIINSNVTGYTNKYETRIFTYNAAEQPLFNEDDAAYNELNTILKTQTRPTGIPDLYYYDASYDKFSYISKKTLTDTSGRLLGYVFVLATPKKFKTEALAPELFSRGHNNSIENSSSYAYAIYNNWKLISSHNDYPFATTLNKDDFPEKQPFFTRKGINHNELWYKAGPDKMVVIARQNSLSIESLTLFSYLFCSFLVLSAVFWFFNMLIRSRLRPAKLKSYWQLSIRNQIHGTIIFISVLSFFVIGGATILFFISRYESNNNEKLSRAIHIVETEVKKSITGSSPPETSLSQAEQSNGESLETIINKISEIHGLDVNIYDLEGNLTVSSLPLPYIKGVLSTKMDPQAYYHMNHNREVQYFQKEHIGQLTFVSDYIPGIDASGNNYAYINIPYFTSESNLKNEISNFVVTIINLNAFIFILAGIIALFIANRITSSFELIANKMKQVNLEKRNEYIQWDRDDELGTLVAEYNKMVTKLDQSVMALAKTEREGAWREMARQVAHEIKNPLTPMKLSMQFLQKSIENNAPNVKELTANVANTLIEQIDHLSQIAGEFSQFANIENAKKEFFDLNETLRVVIQLYESNDRLEIEEEFLDEKIIVEADRTHINRLFSNLILNALQATPENRTARVKIKETLEPGFVTITISDNGSGIPVDIQDKIFMPNFTTKTSGTGLGLAMCKRMVEQAKGQIWFESGENGTDFFVKLPVAIIV